MRERNRTQIPKPHENLYETWNGNSYPLTTYDTKVESMDDIVTPGYHSRSRSGEIFNNACHYESDTFTIPSSDCVYESLNQGDPAQWVRKTAGNLTGYLIASKLFPYQYDYNSVVLPTHDVGAEAKQQCLANVDAVPYEFFEDLMEIRETIRFLKNPLASIAGLGRAFGKKRNRIQKHDTMSKNEKIKALADLWNQYRFAFSPLVRSAMTALEAYNARSEDHRPVRRSAHGRYGSANGPTTELSFVAKGISRKFHYEKVSTATLDGHASILYEVDNPLDDWRFRLGLRSKDIPTTMWEIVPLSFMVDRIVNIRDAISGLINLADPNVSFLACSYTEKTNWFHTLSCYREVWSYGEKTVTLLFPDLVEFSKFEYDRVVWSPTAPDVLPTWDPGGLTRDLTKILDLLAISISRLL